MFPAPTPIRPILFRSVDIPRIDLPIVTIREKINQAQQASLGLFQKKWNAGNSESEASSERAEEKKD
ncbi:hypothetical protein C8R46DRAFT_1205457 [Mycena filopes]|nr:hypothetical protein C8R46DRAFT_1236869 [Mycena filopes]KAJ7188280.1 hypothetical protein C8R46DRAFT_1205457 [Mycena filopes]